MLPPPIVKQPHYVWRHYLEAWEVRGKLHVLRDDKPFASAAAGVAKEGGFHDLPILSDDDVEFLMATSVRPGSPQEQQHREFINFMVVTQRVSSAVAANPRSHSEEEVAWANKILRDTEETLASSVEDLGLPWLSALRDADCAFLNSEENNLFFYFVAMQYLRTKAVARSVSASVRGSKLKYLEEKFERTWPLMRQIHAVDIAAGLFGTRQSYDLVFLDNESAVDFIAGDQPMINIYSVERRDRIPEKFELYYPLTPRRAMLWTQAFPGQQGARFRVGESVVQHHNRMIAAASHEMIFASSRAALEPFRSN